MNKCEHEKEQIWAGISVRFIKREHDICDHEKVWASQSGMRLLGAAVMVTTIWRWSLGAETFSCWAVLALARICLITITHTSLSLVLCIFHLGQMFFKKATVFFKKATNVVRLSWWDWAYFCIFGLKGSVFLNFKNLPFIFAYSQ